MRIGSEKGGQMQLEYTTFRLREGESFLIFIDSVEVLKETVKYKELDKDGFSSEV